MPATVTDRLNGLTTSVAVKAPVQAVSTANLTLSGLQTVGGVALAEGDRVLVKDQTSAVDNGIYDASTSAWTRSLDFDGNRDVVHGTLVVRYGDGIYQVTSANPIVIGTSSINFTQRVLEVSSPVNVTDYGIVANDQTAAAANTTALKALVSPSVNGGTYTLTGQVNFPNPGGTDVYHFNNIIPFRDGIYADLHNSTLTFTASGADATKQDVGFITIQRDGALRNGTINVVYPTGGASQGQALVIGSRNVGASTYFATSYDSGLTTPQGNVTVEKMKFTSNHPSAYLVYLTGGLRNVTFDGIDLDGQSVCGGIYYEYGWATNEAAAADRQTSHAHNLVFRNIRAVNLVASAAGVAVSGNGAYGVTIENVHVVGGYAASVWGPGESMNYRPWTAPDLAMVKRHIMMRNINAKSTASNAIVMTGATSGGYLASVITALGHPADYVAQTDLLDFTLDGFSIDSATGYGVYSIGAKGRIRNGKITSCQRGIVTTTECVEVDLDSIEIINCSSIGIQIGLTSDKWSPGRFSRSSIKNCKIAGGATIAISLSQTVRCLIQNNRFGYDITHDGVAESTQTIAVSAGLTASGVICDSNYVADAIGGIAYSKTGGPADCVITNATGIAVTSGLFRNSVHKSSSVTYSTSITFDCSAGNEFVTTPTNGTGFAINAPLYPMSDQRISIMIRNASGGALGTITWNAVFKMAAFTSPATGFSRSIDFKYNGTNWIEVGRATADVPN